MPEPRSPYPSDLSDTEWSLLEPLLESPERRGRPPKWPARRVADAVFYLLRSGCAWRMLPKESTRLGRDLLLPLLEVAS
jgi:transposase